MPRKAVLRSMVVGCFVLLSAIMPSVATAAGPARSSVIRDYQSAERTDPTGLHLAEQLVSASDPTAYWRTLTPDQKADLERDSTPGEIQVQVPGGPTYTYQASPSVVCAGPCLPPIQPTTTNTCGSSDSMAGCIGEPGAGLTVENDNGGTTIVTPTLGDPTESGPTSLGPLPTINLPSTKATCVPYYQLHPTVTQRSVITGIVLWSWYVSISVCTNGTDITSFASQTHPSIGWPTYSYGDNSTSNSGVGTPAVVSENSGSFSNCLLSVFGIDAVCTAVDHVFTNFVAHASGAIAGHWGWTS
jgi:hypothetical protein